MPCIPSVWVSSSFVFFVRRRCMGRVYCAKHACMGSREVNGRGVEWLVSVSAVVVAIVAVVAVVSVAVENWSMSSE